MPLRDLELVRVALEGSRDAWTMPGCWKDSRDLKKPKNQAPVDQHGHTAHCQSSTVSHQFPLSTDNFLTK